MSDYLEVARRALAAWLGPPEPKKQEEPHPAELASASGVLNGDGARIMGLEGTATIRHGERKAGGNG